MELVPSAEQLILRDNVHRYLNDNYSFAQRRAMLQDPGQLARARWLEFAQLGWLGTTAPEADGGSGGLREAAVILEEFGRFLVLEPFLQCAIVPIEILKHVPGMNGCQNILAELTSGRQMVAAAHSESAARGALRFVATRATALGGGRHLLSGRKSAVLAGALADKIIVSARTAGGTDDAQGISLFLIDSGIAGLTLRSYRTIDDRSAADLTLQDVEVGPEALLGTEGKALPALRSAFGHGVLGSCAEAVGIMDAVITRTIEYLKTRRTYGNTLSSYQALQHRVADMLSEVELSRSMLLRALHADSSCEESVRYKNISGARVLIGRAGRFVASSGIQLHGAMGVVDQHIVGHYLKRLTVTFALCGSATHHLRQYARSSYSAA